MFFKVIFFGFLLKTLAGPIKNVTVKENHISHAVTEILPYIHTDTQQTDRHPV